MKYYMQLSLVKICAYTMHHFYLKYTFLCNHFTKYAIKRIYLVCAYSLKNTQKLNFIDCGKDSWQNVFQNLRCTCYAQCSLLSKCTLVVRFLLKVNVVSFFCRTKYRYVIHRNSYYCQIQNAFRNLVLSFVQSEPPFSARSDLCF